MSKQKLSANFSSGFHSYVAPLHSNHQKIENTLYIRTRVGFSKRQCIVIRQGRKVWKGLNSKWKVRVPLIFRMKIKSLERWTNETTRVFHALWWIHHEFLDEFHEFYRWSYGCMWYLIHDIGWTRHTREIKREREKEEESISRFDKRLGKNSVCRLFIGFTRERSERMQRAAHRWKRPSTALAFASFTLRSEYSTAESLVCRVPRITFEGIYCAVGNAAASTLLVVWLVFSPRLWNIRRI